MRLFTSCALYISPQSVSAICTPSRIASGLSPSRARTSARRDSIRASDIGITIRPHPEIYPVAPQLTVPVGRRFLRERAHARATVEQFFWKANSRLRSGRTKALHEE